jgi:hypothetical protein
VNVYRATTFCLAELVDSFSPSEWKLEMINIYKFLVNTIVDGLTRKKKSKINVLKLYFLLSK